MTEAFAKRIAVSLIPELQKYAAKAGELRRIPPESADMLIANGLLQTILPAPAAANRACWCASTNPG
jgi:hypothetical protein